MSRSLKKGPFVASHLLKKINALDKNKKTIIETFEDENSDINPYYFQYKSHYWSI